MGVTIHYRGRLADLSRVEDFEDRVIDLALAVGGNVRLWRSADPQHPERMVRGLILDLAPGQESTSLLLSPEGWLINLFQIEDAERGAIAKPPWCFVKTQFGPIEGHVALIELLTQLQVQFMPDLEVHDESGYWEHRDVARLQASISQVAGLIDGLAEALEQDRLSPEAAEDPEILATRIQRLAAKVLQTMSRPAEHPPVLFADDASGGPPDALENEARWDALYQENRRRQEYTQRTIEEALIAGDELEDALDRAAPQDLEPDQPGDAIEEDDFDEGLVADEPWEAETFAAESEPEDEAHPLQSRATKLLLEFHALARTGNRPDPGLDQLMRNACEITGGLAQALPLPPAYELDDVEAGLRLVQLKRAMRGAAFVTGALHLLLAAKTIDRSQFKQWAAESNAIATEAVDLMRLIRESQR